ncbi:cytochrome P450 [Lentinus tigrinus ALCF2SS1-7]|uniref:Cytochrome P450 n=1 Tax=Lentinus tigrinus ALCF2SS1-6 TaxID=1328759 RepID=A0A5C2S0L2_9APHY|nr:cytochrome P450 [Lentinus tigrinus ALCF2SS1-6]RPD71756.1 cytochrome P450 [Lentinus tigrinus ALCF2SS1-7]
MSALLSSFPTTSLLGSIAIVALGVLLQRLFLHPLSRFPGPKVAAATWWYMTYYEVFKDGAMIEHLNDLHARYGPVVRISPNQLHFKGLEAYTDIYSNSNRFIKDSRTYCFIRQGSPAVFSLLDVREAKPRRDYLSPIFSRRALLKLEPVIQAKVDGLVQQFRQYGEAGKPANIRRGYRSFTTEVVFAYCFGSDEDYMSAPDFAHKAVRSSEAAFDYFLVFVHFPWMYVLVRWMVRLAAWRQPQSSAHLERLRAKIDGFADDPQLLWQEPQETMFHHLVAPQPETGREGIRSKSILWAEANNMVGAGSETTASILTVATFYVLNDASIRKRLVTELVEAWPDVDMQVGLETLEKLPYLTAVIKEALRVGHGIVGPLPRIVTPNDAIIAGHAVPAGTVVAAGHSFIHLDPVVFPDPYAFCPDRWLGGNKDLDQYLVVFSRGPRQCIGVNLAWSELYLVLGNVFRKLEMELHDTTIEDMQYRCQLTPTYRGKMPHCTVAPRKELSG